MNYKTSYTLSSATSGAGRSVRRFGSSANVSRMLSEASAKLSPIIESVVEDSKSTSKYLTTQQFENLVVASNLIKNVSSTLKLGRAKNEIRNFDFNLEKFKVNNMGLIYIDTPLLFQLIELHNTLEDVKEYVDPGSDDGVNSFVQTDAFGTEVFSDSNRIIMKLLKPLPLNQDDYLEDKKENGWNLKSNFIIMPSLTEVLDENKNSNDAPTTKGVISTGTVMDEATVKVTDVNGAKEIIAKCICDLEQVKGYLSKERKDVGTMDSRTFDSDDFPERRKSDGKSEPRRSGQLSQDRCCCSDTCIKNLYGGSQADLEECGDDKVIICIKGRNEDEGDVQIVIRQCPDCKKIEGTTKQESASAEPEKSPNKTEEPKKSPSQPKKQESKHEPEQVQEMEPQKSESRVKSAPSIPTRDDESYSLHNKGSEGSYVCSEESGEDTGKLNVIFDPQDVSKSVVEPSPAKEAPSNNKKTILKSPSSPRSSVQFQSETTVECSRIKLYETTKLCLKTEGGEELMICLTVTPNTNNNNKMKRNKMILKDLFSDEEAASSASQNEMADKAASKSDNKIKFDEPAAENVENNTIVSMTDTAKEDRIIPLMRTKICSSLDFDVTVADSNLRRNGIDHKNPEIIVQLKEFGVDNLLRACRPAKCCRKALLNEKMKKCLPYPPSLRSLPLDEEDIKVINESLQRSLQKVKNSTNISEDYKNHQTFFVAPIFSMYYLLNNNVMRMRRPLSYYINLVNDVKEDTNPPVDYTVMYFEVEDNYLKTNSNEKTTQHDERALNVDLVEVLSNPFKWVREKYTRMEERPLLVTQAEGDLKNIFKQKTPKDSRSVKTSAKLGYKKELTKKIPKQHSRIPIYQRTAHFKQLSKLSGVKLHSSECHLLEEKETNRKGQYENRNNEKRFNISSDSISTYIRTIFTNSHDFTTNEKKSDNTSHSLLRKIRRKKSEFYFSKSRSEIYLKGSSDKRISTIDISSTIPKTSSVVSKKKLSDIHIKETAKLVIDYFSKMLYEMVLDGPLINGRRFNFMKNVISTDSNKQRSRRELDSQHCIENQGDILRYNKLEGRLNRKKRRAVKNVETSPKSENDQSIQTPTVIHSDKECQTLVNNPIVGQNKELKRKVFKTCFNEEILSKLPNSCDEMDNFVVVFKSDASLASNLSRNTDSSCSSKNSLEGRRKDEMNKSLAKLQEALDEFEKFCQNGVIPFSEFCVYNNSTFQTLLNKTKGIIGSSCLQPLHGGDHGGKPKKCKECGCLLDKCPPKSDDSKKCDCPPENKKRPKVKTKPKKVRDPSKSRLNLSKFKTTSASSLKKLNAFLRKSLSTIWKRSKAQEAKLCDCSSRLRPGACQCDKCDAFSPDGSCCCSHCLGCLDKSFHAQPESVGVGVMCGCESFAKSDNVANVDVPNVNDETPENVPVLDGDSVQEPAVFSLILAQPDMISELGERSTVMSLPWCPFPNMQFYKVRNAQMEQKFNEE